LNKPPPIIKPPERGRTSPHIEKRLPLQDIFDTPPGDAAGGVESSGRMGRARASICSACCSPRDERMRNTPHEEVKRAIADYCAAQPNTVASNPTCASAAVR
jgi:hypothetical protein